MDHQYEIKEGRHKMAPVSKKWFRVHNAFGVEIAPNVALDQMASN